MKTKKSLQITGSNKNTAKVKRYVQDVIKYAKENNKILFWKEKSS